MAVILEVWNWCINNKEWLFSGLGIALIGWVMPEITRRFFSKNRFTNSMNQSNINFSHGTQIGIQNNHYGKSDKNDK